MKYKYERKSEPVIVKILKSNFLVLFLILEIASPSVYASYSSQADRYRVIDNSNDVGNSEQASNSGNTSGPSGNMYTGGTSNSGSTSGNIKKPTNNAFLSPQRIELRKGQSRVINLFFATKNVKWSVSGEAVKYKKKGTSVVVTYRKAGKSSVKAIYKGKTFECKITCLRKPIMDVMDISTRNTHTFFYNNILELDSGSRYSGAILVEIKYGDSFGFDVSPLKYEIEDPGIVTCEWVDLPPNTAMGTIKGSKNLLVGALRYGSTKITITNSYNSEKEYVTVIVKDTGEGNIDEIPRYEPISDKDREFVWWGTRHRR